MKKLKALLGVILSVVLFTGGILPQVGAVLSEVVAAPTTHELALNVTVEKLNVTIIRKDTNDNKIFADIVKENLPKNAVIRLNLSEGDGTAGYEISQVRLGSKTATLAELGDGQIWDVDSVNNTLEVIYKATEDPDDSFDVTFYDYDYSAPDGGGMNDARNYAAGSPEEQRIGVGISGDDYHVGGLKHPEYVTVDFGSDLGMYQYDLMVKVTNPKTGVEETINANSNNGVDAGAGYGINGTGWPLAIGMIERLDADGNPVWGKDANGNQIYDPGLFTNEAKLGKHIYTKDTEGLNGNSRLNFKRDGYHYVLQSATVGATTTNGGTGNPRFYPLDNVPSAEGQKFVDPWINGSEIEDTNPHNWYFGIRHEFNFTLGEYEGPLEYTFEGDDDVWVFLDGELVLDMGGVHCVYPNDYNNTQDKIDRGENSWPNTVDLWTKIDKTEANYKTKEHTVTILYMERGGYDSNCYMEFTIPVNPPADFDATIDIPVTVKWIGLDEAEEHGNNPTSPNPTIYLLDGSDENQSKVDAIREKLKNSVEPADDEIVYKQTVDGGILKDEDGKTVIFEKASLDEGVTNYTALSTEYSDFEAVVTGNMSDGFMVTYTYKPQRTTVSVKKVWNPTSATGDAIWVKLLADGTQYGDLITLNAGNDWQATVSNLLVRRNGNEVSYTVEEVSTPDGYTTTVTGNVSDGYIITNNKDYNAKYQFKKADDSMPNLPSAVLALRPTDTDTYKSGDTVNAKAVSTTTVTVADGTWTFTGYENDSLTVSDDDVTFVGVWSFTPKSEYNVTHVFESGTSGKDLPAEITAMAPPVMTAFEGDTVNPTMPADTTYDAGDGIWTFQSYDQGTVTVTANVTYTGTWTYEAKPTHTVSHTFKSGTAGYELPAEIAALEPADYSVIEGTTVNPTYPAETVIDDPGDSDYYWTLTGYDKQNVVVDTDVEFIGTWVRMKKPTVDVKYVFQSDDGSTLPEEVMALKPVDTVETWDETKEVFAPTITPATVEAPDKSGTWTFISWDENSHFASDNMTFTGTWHFDAYPEYKVEHTFVSGTSGKELPAEVKALEPTDSTIKKTHTAYAVYPDETRVETADGIWTFSSYDKLKVEDVNGDVEFIGTWVYAAKPDYPVEHTFVSGTPGKTLPAEVTGLVPAGTTVLEGETANAVNPGSTRVEAADGIWSFTGYDKTEVTNVHEAVEFEGTWTWEEYTYYPVEHTFVSGTSGKTLPASVTGLTPNPSTVIKGRTANSVAPEQTSVDVEDGTWTFTGYDKNEVTNVNDEVTFTGTWTFEKFPEYPVKHNFVSGTSGKELPAAVTSLKPQDTTVMKGKTVNAVNPAELTVEAEDGVWTFTGYDKTQVTDVNGEVIFNGTWTFAPYPEYPVTHTFVSGTAGKELPAAVTTLKPDDFTVYEGKTANAVNPSEVSVDVEDGTWSFTGYDKTQVENVTDAVNFEGTWTFTAYPEYPVTHTFVSGTAGKELPAAVATLKPGASSIMKGKTAEAVSPAELTVKVEDGTWTFTGYDKDKVEGVTGAVNFEGTWTFTAKPVYPVTHVFVSGTAGKELPQAVKTLTPGDFTVMQVRTAVATTPSKVTVDVDGGAWVFVGYDKTQVADVNGSVTFTGTWKFTEKQVYQVKYNFVSGTSGKDLPEEIMKLLPSSDDKYVNGVTVTPEQLSQLAVETPDGVWRFVSWDKAGIVVDGSDINFGGVWTFTAKAAPAKSTPVNNNPVNTASPVSPKTGEDGTWAGVCGAAVCGTCAILALLSQKRKKDIL